MLLSGVGAPHIAQQDPKVAEETTRRLLPWAKRTLRGDDIPRGREAAEDGR